MWKNIQWLVSSTTLVQIQYVCFHSLEIFETGTAYPVSPNNKQWMGPKVNIGKSILQNQQEQG